jgi:hypothetical protein
MNFNHIIAILLIVRDMLSDIDNEMNPFKHMYIQ